MGIEAAVAAAPYPCLLFGFCYVESILFVFFKPGRMVRDCAAAFYEQKSTMHWPLLAFARSIIQRYPPQAQSPRQSSDGDCWWCFHGSSTKSFNSK
jgi:hypothetical protein